MTEAQTELMSLGLTYWPRRTGYGWWRAYDRGEVRDELAHIATLGCDTVRFCLRWEDFQPAPQRINGAALRALEHALDTAHEAGLRVVAALFPVALGGALQVPQWVNQADVVGELRRTARFGSLLVVRPAHQPPLLYENGYHTNQARDLFNDPAMLDAQRYLIREVTGYFGTHPALWAWQPGEGLERIGRPGSAEAVYDWLAATGDAIVEHDADARLLGVTSARALMARFGPRPEHLAATCDLLGVAADPPEPLPDERPLHTRYVAYLHALTAALGAKPAFVSSVALPTAPDGHAGWIADSAYGQPIRAYLGDEEQQAEFVGAALEQLQRSGARGAWLAAYADHPPELWRTPPFDRATRSRTLGLVDADGREKRAAAVLRAFAAARPAVAQAAPPLAVDAERYWRDPKRAFAELWREFSAEA